MLDFLLGVDYPDVAILVKCYCVHCLFVDVRSVADFTNEDPHRKLRAVSDVRCVSCFARAKSTYTPCCFDVASLAGRSRCIACS